MKLNPRDVENEIEEECRRAGHQLGWRLLASPWRVVSGAEVAFIGLNPGGGEKEENHGLLSTEGGSAYVIEQWKNRDGSRAAAGASHLQQQVRSLFRHIEVDPADVLAGNLVPFRSANWTKLDDPNRAIAYGRNLWGRLIQEAQPRLIVTMGSRVFSEMHTLLGSQSAELHPAGWGTVTIKRAFSKDCLLIGLPHLSRFGLFGRSQSEEGLYRAFADFESKVKPKGSYK